MAKVSDLLSQTQVLEQVLRVVYAGGFVTQGGIRHARVPLGNAPIPEKVKSKTQEGRPSIELEPAACLFPILFPLFPLVPTPS